MKLRMLTHLGGTHDGEPWPLPGGIVEMAMPTEADVLVRTGQAEIVREAKPKPVIETAEKAPPENAAKRTAKPQPRRKAVK